MDSKGVTDDEKLPFDGNGGILGILGAIVFLGLYLVLMLSMIVFFIGKARFKLKNNRTGTICSVSMLPVLTVILTVANFLALFSGLDELNREGYSITMNSKDVADDERAPPDGKGGIFGILGAIVLSGSYPVLMLLRTVFFTRKAKLKSDNNRIGTICSAGMHSVLTVIYAVVNLVASFSGLDELNREGYFIMMRLGAYFVMVRAFKDHVKMVTLLGWIADTVVASKLAAWREGQRGGRRPCLGIG